MCATQDTDAVFGTTQSSCRRHSARSSRTTGIVSTPMPTAARTRSRIRTCVDRSRIRASAYTAWGIKTIPNTG